MLSFVDRLAQGGRLYALSVVYLALFPGAARGLSKFDLSSRGPSRAHQNRPRANDLSAEEGGGVSL